MTAEQYLLILMDEFKPAIYKLLANDWVFQHDGAGPHGANIIKHIFYNNIPALLQWPARSPDISPIENIWNILKKQVYARNPKTIEEL